jgi:3'-5' exoribonuclease
MKTFISELTANQTVSSTFLVKSKELRNKKSGGQFVLVTLSDKSGDIVGQWWDNFEDTIHTFDRDDVVFVRGLVNTYRNHLQIAIHRMRLCEEREIELAHYFPSTRHDVDKMFAELHGRIEEFTNPFLRELLLNIFSDERTVDKFKRAPAAKTMHHPYLGGLLEHSLSVMRLCRKVGSHYEGLDIELLETGAILHDFGKIDELSYDRGFGYTLDGQLIGHLTMETMMVSEHISRIPDFPDELRRQVLHILLAHHGKLEHGSPKLPMTPEALVVAYLDDLDSKVEAMQRLIAEPHSLGDWTRITPMFERPIYRRRPDEIQQPVAQLENLPEETVAPQSGQGSDDTGTSEGAPEAQPAQTGAAAGSGAGVNQSGAAAESTKTVTKPAPRSFNTPFAQLADLIKE